MRPKVRVDALNPPKRIAITGAAGQIAYSLVFRIGVGGILGKNQPVILQLLDVPGCKKAMEGVRMELEDCAYPLLLDVTVSDDPMVAFQDCDYALLIGSRPRGPGMERKDLLEVNGDIFRAQGRALNEQAHRDVKVLVVGNPANTNALIALRNAPDLNPKQFTAMTRLDHNRALSLLARKSNQSVSNIARMSIWGNHSSTQYPDISATLIEGQPAFDVIDPDWYRNSFIPTIQQRGAAIMQARGKSSAASAGFAAMDHIYDWSRNTREGDWVSMGIPSDGSYGIPEGLVFSFPVVIKGGEYSIVQNLPLDAFSQSKLTLTRKELEGEREAIKHLLG